MGACSFWKAEFTRDYVLMKHNSPADFATPQCGKHQLAYVIYRWAAFILFISLLLYEWFGERELDTLGEYLTYYFIKLTRWTNVVFYIYLGISAGTATYHHVKWQDCKEIYADLPTIFKIQWVLFEVLFSATVTITLLYWMLLSNEFGSWLSVFTHGINAVIMLVDLFIGATPVRLLHFWYSSMFATAYTLFSAIYWAAGGTNQNGDPYIYSTLDWGNSPTSAVAIAIALVFLAEPLLHFVMFLLYQLRVYIHRRTSKPTVHPA